MHTWVTRCKTSGQRESGIGWNQIELGETTLREGNQMESDGKCTWPDAYDAYESHHLNESHCIEPEPTSRREAQS